MDIYEQLDIPDNDRPTSIRKDEAEFLYAFLLRNKLRHTAETGFAYGCSTAYIIHATGSSHIAIDPNQECYKGLGLKNIDRLGLTKYLRFIAQPSHVALPELLHEEMRLDFAFVDGGHKYDEIFVDWYYFDLLLKHEGYIFFHDSWMRSTQMVVSFIEANRADYKRMAVPLQNLIAFQKIGTDSRTWDHFEEFSRPPSRLK